MPALIRLSVALIFVLLFAGPVGAAEASTSGGLHPVDWGIIGAYVLMTLGIGWYYGRQQESTEEYFVGSGKMNPVLIGVSLFATLLSTISYLSMPGESLGKGPVGMVGIAAYPVVFLIVAVWMLPVYMKQRVTSAYELLETKLGLSIRMLGAIMFVSLRLVWMSLLVFLSAKALVTMIEIEGEPTAAVVQAAAAGDADSKAIVEDFNARQARAIQLTALFVGMIAVIYTSIGGLRAVVVTDFLQTIFLYGGALLVIGTVSWKMGGFGWFPTAKAEHWDHQPWFSFDPSTRMTIVGLWISTTVWFVSTLGGDQTTVQRFMATEDLRAARKALAMQLTVAAIVGITLGMVGFALLGFYQQGGAPLPVDDLAKNADKVFPRFIVEQLPVGITGLVVAAIFAAAMSSIDSGVNSITAVVVTDFLDRFRRKPLTEEGHVMLARMMAFTIGAAVVLGSSYLGAVPGNITAVTNRTSNLLTTPIFALFFFALFVPFARPAGVWAGAICGVATASIIAFSGPIVVWLYTQFGVSPETFGVVIEQAKDEFSGKPILEAKPSPISFQLIAPVALAVNLGVGTLVSLALSRKRTEEE